MAGAGAGSFAEQVARLKERGIPADKIDEYRAAFDLFDPTHSGRLTADKLGHLLNETFGQSYGVEDLKYMLQQFHESGEVSFYAFASTLHDKLADPRYNEAFGDAFDLFDSGRTGELSKDELQAAMLKLGERLTDAEAEEMLKIAKKKDDFVRAMTNAISATAPSAGGGGGGGGGGAVAAPAAAGAGPAAAPARPMGPGGPGAAAAAAPGGAPRPPRPGGAPSAPAAPSADGGGGAPSPSGPPRPPRPGGAPASPSPGGGPPRPPRPPVPA